MALMSRHTLWPMSLACVPAQCQRASVAASWPRWCTGPRQIRRAVSSARRARRHETTNASGFLGNGALNYRRIGAEMLDKIGNNRHEYSRYSTLWVSTPDNNILPLPNASVPRAYAWLGAQPSGLWRSYVGAQIGHPKSLVSTVSSPQFVSTHVSKTTPSLHKRKRRKTFVGTIGGKNVRRFLDMSAMLTLRFDATSSRFRLETAPEKMPVVERIKVRLGVQRAAWILLQALVTVFRPL